MKIKKGLIWHFSGKYIIYKTNRRLAIRNRYKYERGNSRGTGVRTEEKNGQLL